MINTRHIDKLLEGTFWRTKRDLITDVYGEIRVRDWWEWVYG